MKKALFVLAFSFMFASLFCQTSVAQAGKSKTSGVRAHNVFPIEEGLVDAHGVLIYYTIVGRGAPLMVVHGGPGASHDYFLPYLLPLARSNKLTFIDERGSGRSEKLEDPSQYTVDRMTKI